MKIRRIISDDHKSVEFFISYNDLSLDYVWCDQTLQYNIETVYDFKGQITKTHIYNSDATKVKYKNTDIFKYDDNPYSPNKIRYANFNTHALLKNHCITVMFDTEKIIKTLINYYFNIVHRNCTVPLSIKKSLHLLLIYDTFLEKADDKFKYIIDENVRILFTEYETSYRIDGVLDHCKMDAESRFLNNKNTVRLHAINTGINIKEFKLIPEWNDDSTIESFFRDTDLHFEEKIDFLHYITMIVPHESSSIEPLDGKCLIQIKNHKDEYTTKDISLCLNRIYNEYKTEYLRQ